MRTIASLNQKGGVGKTTTAFNLAGALAQRGLRTLAIDVDPQASLSRGLLGEDVVEALDPVETVAAVLAGDGPPPAAVIRPTGCGGLDLLPSGDAAHRFNEAAPNELPYERQVALREFLAEAGESYDIALIDGPPNLYGCSWNALAAADALIVVMQPEDFGAQGMKKVTGWVELVRATVNPELVVLGHLLNLFDNRLNLHRAYADVLRARFTVFETVVGRMAEVSQAASFCRPVSFSNPGGKAAETYGRLADELLGRLAARGLWQSEGGPPAAANDAEAA